MRHKIIIIAALLVIARATLAAVSPDQIQIPKGVKEDIKERAYHEWPDDYSMQAYEIDKQADAYRNLYAWAKNNSNNELAESIFDRAQKEWPDDYSMQWYQVEREVAAVRKIYADENE